MRACLTRVNALARVHNPAVRARWQLVQMPWPDRDADQAESRKAYCGRHAPNLAVFAFLYRQLKP